MRKKTTDWREMKKNLFSLPIAANETAIKYVRKYARCGSSDLPFPTEKYFNFGKIISRQTAWNTFGAPTRLAEKANFQKPSPEKSVILPKALDNVAANIPANRKRTSDLLE